MTEACLSAFLWPVRRRLTFCHSLDHWARTRWRKLRYGMAWLGHVEELHKQICNLLDGIVEGGLLDKM